MEDLETLLLPTHSKGSRIPDELCTTDESEEDRYDGDLDGEMRETPEIEWSININNLPGELICDILEIASDSAPNATSFAFCASLVCKLWKELAFAAPKLWGRIDAEQSLEVVAHLLKRSKRAPLDIRIYLNPMIPENEGVTQIRAFAALVAQERYRIRAFTFHYYYPSWLKAGSSLLTSKPVIAVDSLDIRRLEYYNPSIQMNETTVGADQITFYPRCLRYDDIHLPITLTQVPIFSSSLKSLEVGWSSGSTPITVLLHLLSLAKNLEYLHLTCLTHLILPIRSVGGHTPYLLPSLREVILENLYFPVIVSLFSLMETPVLESLLIDAEMNSRPAKAIISFGRPNPQLRCLHLKSCALLRSWAWEFAFRYLPSLTHLQLSNCGQEGDVGNILDCLVATGRRTHSNLCPNLSSIIFDCVESIPWTSAVRLVKSRIGLDGVSPINTFKWTWLSPKKATNLIEALETLVPDLVIECFDMEAIREPSESSEPSEEWLSEGGDIELDSGDEEVIASAE